MLGDFVKRDSIPANRTKAVKMSKLELSESKFDVLEGRTRLHGTKAVEVVLTLPHVKTWASNAHPPPPIVVHCSATRRAASAKVSAMC